MATPKRSGRPRSQLPPCYHEGFLEKKSIKDKMGRKLWTSLCGSSLFFFNNNKDNTYVEKLDLCDLISVTDVCSRDRKLDAAIFNLQMKNEDIKMIAPSLEARELWKGFILSVAKLSVPSSLNLLPGQIHMMKEVIEKEKERQEPPSPSGPNLYVSVVPEMPACYHAVSRAEAELLLERNPERGNLMLRPGRDGSSFAVTTRQNINGSVFKHYRVSRKHEGGFAIDLESPISCATLHEVITCLVERTNGVLEPFLMEEHYEETITFVQANEENGELSLHCAPSGPLVSPPVPPPKPVKRNERANSEPPENIYLNDTDYEPDETNLGASAPSTVQPRSQVRLLPHQISVPFDLNKSSGGEKKALKPPGYPIANLRSQSMTDMSQNVSQHRPQPDISEELKMIFKRRALQE